jgi:predicted Zn-dependent protease
LGIPDDALLDKQVDELSLRFRNSAYAHVLAHEMGHVLHRHPGNRAVPADVSRSHERQADEFALRVLRRDKQIPMGAILFFQMTAFIVSPGRFDFPTVEEWQKALREATHPVTSDRVRGLAEGLRNGADQYGANREIALDVADKLRKIAAEMDDRDWQLYFRRIGELAPLTRLRPRKE